MPFHQQPVRRQSAVKRAGRNAIQIRLIFPANGAQPVQIEMRVAQLQGIKRPLNETDSAAQGLLALKEFKHAAHAAVAVFAVHPRHVGMQVSYAAPQARNRERKAHQAITVECPQRLTACMRGDHKQGRWLDFQIGFSPNRALQVDTMVEVIEALAFPDDNLPAHLFVGAPFISCNRGFPSALLLASHNASISSRGRFLNSRPFFRASLSISRKRRENFVLAFLSAISGSIFRNRESFTAAKSKSTTSSS